ncbi:hypothetical protein CLJ1_0443 [Pseudomonas paraeruginosa]|nr:hypothetical protein CSC28_0517 [Pseudomonas paraeruginosa]PTC39500.1 hypothetical protein CLJ1_0443 [Pseudomonas aeruginosa]
MASAPAPASQRSKARSLHPRMAGSGGTATRASHLNSPDSPHRLNHGPSDSPPPPCRPLR